MEENCIGSQSPQRTVVLEKKKKKGIISAVKMVEFVADRRPHM
jgi:hypothetical protein